jgi:hypothetical protein
MAEDADQVAEEGSPEEPEVAAEDEAAGEFEVDIYAVLRYCLALVIQQAWVHLGLRAAQGATETKTDLPKAKVAIDMAAMLYEQVKPVAAEDEKRSVDTEMANLRINYAHRAEPE